MKFQDIFGEARYVSGKGREGEEIYPYIRRAFSLPEEPAKATLTVSFLGFGEIHCNGQRVNPDLFITPYSQYGKQTRDDVNNPFQNDAYFEEEHGYTIYAASYDVTNYVQKGENALVFTVAGGWYRSGKDKSGNFRHYGPLGVAFRLVLKDGAGRVTELLSDGECRAHESFLLLAGIFGEEQDETRELSDCSLPAFDDRHWERAEVLPTPEADYLLEGYAKEVIAEYVTPRLIKAGANYRVYDMGRNTTGFPILLTSRVRGARLECLYSEEKTEDNELDERYIHRQRSVFLTDGRREHHIRFTFHGFRYFKVTAPEGVALDCRRAAICHADVKRTATFSCSDPLLNRYFTCYMNSQITNFQCSIPTDCPQIERKGYTGDGQLTAPLGMLLFESRTLYRKWLRDISDGQDRRSGHVPYTAPIFIGCGGGPGGWGIAIVNVPYFYYKIYGDTEILREFYPKMLRYLAYLRDHSEGGLVTTDQKGAWCLGDWCLPDKVELPPPFVNSCFALIALRRVLEISRLIGRSEEEDALKAGMETVGNAILRAYYDEESGDFCQGIQGANLFAVKAGLHAERTLQRLASAYEESMRLDVGIFGLDLLSELLAESGRGDLLLALLHSEREGTLTEWKEAEDATTLFESPKNSRSRNHPMFGSPVKVLFRHLLGITQEEGSAGFERILIAPSRFERISEAQGSVLTVQGEIKVAFLRQGRKTRFTVKLPEGASARFVYRGEERTLPPGESTFSVET